MLFRRLPGSVPLPPIESGERLIYAYQARSDLFFFPYETTSVLRHKGSISRNPGHLAMEDGGLSGLCDNC